MLNDDARGIVAVTSDSHHRTRREKKVIRTDNVTRITTGASIMPATTTTASGSCTCEPMPHDSAIGHLHVKTLSPNTPDYLPEVNYH